PIPVEQGWNLVAFWPSSSMSAEEAFASLGNDLMIVKDAAGNAYIPDESINTLDNGSGQVHPGQGYQVYVSSDAELVYPTSAQTALQTTSGGAQTSENTRGVATSASIVVETPGLDDGTTMIAETSGGVRVGTGTVRNEKALVRVWGDDPQTTTVDGATQGQQLSLRIPSRADQSSISVSNTRNALKGGTTTDLAYTPDAFLTTRADVGELTLTLRDNYPNPVRSATTIEYVLPEQQRVQIEVYDLLGRRVSTLVDQTMPAGSHKVSFDASRLSSGPYFYRMHAGGKTINKKMVVVR
ncbi:T9SS type A sorting domain-containing protein, partial [Longibacter sp.]|uniref:T9SS type A sorting domain-containing protein n=1 Tax=Longibacter sp. TaxID=2045415 RepID=UPI003EB8F170